MKATPRDVSYDCPPPEPGFLVPEHFFDFADDLSDLKDSVDDPKLKAVIDFVQSKESLGKPQNVKELLEISHRQSSALYIDVYNAMLNSSLKSELYFKDPVEHTKYCALNAMKILRKIDYMAKQQFGRL